MDTLPVFFRFSDQVIVVWRITMVRQICAVVPTLWTTKGVDKGSKIDTEATTKPKMMYMNALHSSSSSAFSCGWLGVAVPYRSPMVRLKMSLLSKPPGSESQSLLWRTHVLLYLSWGARVNRNRSSKAPMLTRANAHQQALIHFRMCAWYQVNGHSTGCN